jgi:hypothetical protein
MSIKHWIAVSTAIFLITGCQSFKPQKAGSQFLSSDQVYDLFVDKTVESVGSDTGITSFTYYDRNGQVIQHRFWNERRGQWRIEPTGEICLMMEGDNESCRKISLQPGSFWAVTQDRYYKFKMTSSGPREVVRYRQFIEGNTL